MGISASLMALAAVATTSTATGAVAGGQAITEDELRALAAGVGQDRAAHEAGPVMEAINTVVATLNPDIALILNVALAVFSDAEPQQLGAHDPKSTGFNFQQLELSFGASVDPYFRLDADVIFSEHGVELEEAVATSLALPWNLQVRAGQFLSRFGRINPTHPHAWSFADQPLALGKFFGPENSRGVGAEVSWLAPLPWYLELVASAAGAASECCARSFLGDTEPPVRSPDDLLYTAAVRQFVPFDDDWSLAFGLSGQFGPNDTADGNRTEIYGADVYLRFRPVDATSRAAFSIQAEGLYRSRQVPGDERLDDYGLYAQAVWNIDERWEVGARYELVSGLAADYIDPLWTEDRQRVSAAVTFYPSHFSRFRLQGNYDYPTGIWAGFLAAEMLIGAHGSHEF